MNAMVRTRDPYVNEKRNGAVLTSSPSSLSTSATLLMRDRRSKGLTHSRAESGTDRSDLALLGRRRDNLFGRGPWLLDTALAG